MARNPIITGLDVGTTKICTIIAEIEEGERLNILGVGKSPSRGLKKGIVQDIDQTRQSIEASLATAERMAGVKVESAYVGVTGNHVETVPSQGVVKVEDPRGGISQGDIDRALEACRLISLPGDRRIIDVVVRHFVVDGQPGIKDPIGMSGTRMELNALVITGSIGKLQNVEKSVNLAGVNVQGTILEPIASAEAILTEDERSIGVGMVDIGGGTSDIAVFTRDGLAFTSVLPVGGDHFDNDLGFGLRTPQREAERIKKVMGGVNSQILNSDELIEIPSVGDETRRQVPRKALGEILLPRTEELMELILGRLDGVRVDGAEIREQIPAGMVFTGGGSLLRGLAAVARDQLLMPVRVGRPRRIHGMTDDVDSPIFATGVGLVLLGMKETLRKGSVAAHRRAAGGFFGWLKNIFSGDFS